MRHAAMPANLMTIPLILPNLPILPLLIATITGGQATSPLSPPPSPLPQPPFVRIWTRTFDNGADVIAVRGDDVYCASESGLWAFSVQTGDARWRAFAGADVIDAALHHHRLYAVVRDTRGIALHVVDVATGRPSRLATVSEPPVRITAHDALVFILDRTGTVSAFDARSGDLRWSTPVPVPRDASGRAVERSAEVISGQLAVAGDALYVTAGERGEFGLDLTRGHVLWFRAAKYAGLHAPIVIGGDVILSNDDLRRTHVRTGTVVWSAPLAGDVGLVDHVIIGDDDEGLFGRDVRDGRVLWRHEKADDTATVVSIGRERVPLSDARGVWLDREPLSYRTADGEEIWSRRDLFDGTPYAAVNGIVITADGLRVLAYREGRLAPLPSSDADRQRLAARLISSFELLDRAERAQLEALASYACPLLLDRYVAWARAHEAKRTGVGTLALYSLLDDTAPLLMTIARPADTRAIVRRAQC
jgi:outer membrane protein assembly factor BamB